LYKFNLRMSILITLEISIKKTNLPQLLI
jgi:hypothetical protein